MSCCSENRANDKIGTTPEQSDTLLDASSSKTIESTEGKINEEETNLNQKESTTSPGEDATQKEDNNTSDSGDTIDLPKIGFK